MCFSRYKKKKKKKKKAKTLPEKKKHEVEQKSAAELLWEPERSRYEWGRCGAFRVAEKVSS